MAYKVAEDYREVCFCLRYRYTDEEWEHLLHLLATNGFHTRGGTPAGEDKDLPRWEEIAFGFDFEDTEEHLGILSSGGYEDDVNHSFSYKEICELLEYNDT